MSKAPRLLNRQRRILHFGGFDVENYGDMLFPLLAERRLQKHNFVLTHVAPVGTTKAWAGTAPVISIPEALERALEADGVVLGGGSLIHGVGNPHPPYVSRPEIGNLAYPMMFLAPALLAGRLGLPFVWNAPGVRRPLPASVASFVRWCTSLAQYISVRDRASRNFLRNAGVDCSIAVVPDTALEISDLWSRSALTEAYGDLFGRIGRERPGRSVVVSLKRRHLDLDAESAAKLLDSISSWSEATIVLLALGPCHGDSDVANLIGSMMSADAIIVSTPTSLVEMTACIAHASYYLGSSLHGLIAAASFGVPGLLVADEKLHHLSKFTGFLGQIGIEGALRPSWHQIGPSVLEKAAVLSRAARTRAALADARKSLDVHWKNIAAGLGADRPPVEPREAVTFEKPSWLYYDATLSLPSHLHELTKLFGSPQL